MKFHNAHFDTHVYNIYEQFSEKFSKFSTLANSLNHFHPQVGINQKILSLKDHQGKKKCHQFFS